MAAQPSSAVYSLGLDLGASTTRLAVLDASKPMPTIIRNELSNESTPTVAYFPSEGARCYGETASSKQITQAADTVVDLAPWIFGCDDNCSTKLAVRRVGEVEMHPAQAMAYFMKSILRLVKQPVEVRSTPLCIAAPSFASAENIVALKQACLLAGVEGDHLLHIATSEECIAAYFHHLQFANLSEAEPRHVLIINVGLSSTSVCALEVSTTKVRKIFARSLPMGSGFVDAALCSYVYDEIHNQHPQLNLRGDVKVFRKILRECRKAKEVLSTVESTRVQLESLRGDLDVSINISTKIAERCAAPFLDALRTLLDEVHAALAAVKVEAPRVEVIGGGWRSPFVAAIIKHKLNVDRLGVSLDANLAVAEGAAILARLVQPRASEEKESEPAPRAEHSVELVDFQATESAAMVAEPLSSDAMKLVGEWAVAEEARSQMDAAIHQRLAALNELDAYTLQTLEVVDRCAADSARKEEASRYLMEVDDYLRRDCDEATTEEIVAKLADVTAHITATYPEVAAYHEQHRAAEQQKDEELVKLSKEHKEEDGELKSDPQRLRVAQRRREQGQALFKQECWSEAQTRFVQALAILGELYDTTSEENRTKRAEISLSCHLNIASCCGKLGLWRISINNCTSALEVSPNHPKALYRRGQAHAAMKDYAEAVKDLELAVKLSDGDAGVVAELNRAKSELDRQKQKEKKMFSKMFA